MHTKSKGTTRAITAFMCFIFLIKQSHSSADHLRGSSIDNHETQLQSADLLRKRVLQATFAISESAESKSACQDVGIQTPDYYISEAKRIEMSKTHPRVTRKVSDAFYRFIAKEDTRADFVTLVIESDITFSAIMIIVGAISLPLLCLWSLFECLVQKPVCTKYPRKRAEAHSGCVKSAVWCGVLVAIACLAVLVAWSFYVFKFLDQMKLFKCAIFKTLSDVDNGLALENGNRWIGIKGLNTLVDGYSRLVQDIPASKPNADALLAANLQTKSDDLLTSHSGFLASIVVANYAYSGFSPSSTVTPSTVQTFESLHFTGLSPEVILLAKAGQSIHTTASVVSEFSDVSANQNALNSIDRLRNLTTSVLRYPTVRLRSFFADKDNDAFKTFENYFENVWIALAACIVFVALFYSLAICCIAFKDRMHGSKVLLKIFMLLLVLASLLCFVLSALSTLLVFALSFTCNEANEVMVNSNFKDRIPESMRTTDKLQFFDKCIGPSADGNFATIIGGQSIQLEKLNSLIEGLSVYQSISANLTSQTAPRKGGDLSSYLTSLANLEQGEVASNFQVDSLEAAVEKINSNACSLDRVFYKGKCPVPVYVASKSTDPEREGLGAKYCMELGTNFPASYNSASLARYSSAAECSVATANSELKQLYTTQESFAAKMTSFKNLYENGLYSKELALFSDLKNKKTELDGLKTQMDLAEQRLSGLTKDWSKNLDCRFARKDLIFVENIACNIGFQSTKLNSNLCISAASIMLLLSWCMCCGIRLTVPPFEDHFPLYSKQDMSLPGDSERSQNPEKPLSQAPPVRTEAPQTYYLDDQ
jgi:hypothetical protein